MHHIAAGKLLYGGFQRFWRVGRCDVRCDILKALQAMHEKPAELETTSTSLILRPWAVSELKLYVHGDLIMLRPAPNSFPIKNVAAYINSVFMALNGRMVVVEIEEGTVLSVEPDAEEKVHSVYYEGGSNICVIAPGDEKDVCGYGTGPNACAFIAHTDDGYRCLKFSSFAKGILEKVVSGTYNTQRISSCECLGKP